MNEDRQLPEFILFVGPMFSSKSSMLLATIDRYAYQRRSVVVFKPKLDSRYSSSEICTHSGLKRHAGVVESGDDIVLAVARYEVETGRLPDVIAVDELFMIEGAGKVLINYYRQGVTVVAASIDMSASAEGFDEITSVMPWATRIEKCAAVCMQCGRDAHFTVRKFQTTSDANQIVVGGGDLYEARCFWCHPSIRIG